MSELREAIKDTLCKDCEVEEEELCSTCHWLKQVDQIMSIIAERCWEKDEGQWNVRGERIDFITISTNDGVKRYYPVKDVPVKEG